MIRSEQIPWGSRWKHLKTGNVYIAGETAIIEATMMPAIIYRIENLYGGSWWVRPISEFLDGRFERLEDIEHK